MQLITGAHQAFVKAPFLRPDSLVITPQTFLLPFQMLSVGENDHVLTPRARQVSSLWKDSLDAPAYDQKPIPYHLMANYSGGDSNQSRGSGGAGGAGGSDGSGPKRRRSFRKTMAQLRTIMMYEGADVKYNALSELQFRTDDPEQLEIIAIGLKDRKRSVRVKAGLILAQVGTEQSIQSLKKFRMADGDPKTWQAFDFALEAISAPDRELFFAAVAKNDSHDYVNEAISYLYHHSQDRDVHKSEIIKTIDAVYLKEELRVKVARLIIRSLDELESQTHLKRYLSNSKRNGYTQSKIFGLVEQADESFAVPFVISILEEASRSIRARVLRFLDTEERYEQSKDVIFDWYSRADSHGKKSIIFLWSHHQNCSLALEGLKLAQESPDVEIKKHATAAVNYRPKKTYVKVGRTFPNDLLLPPFSIERLQSADSSSSRGRILKAMSSIDNYQMNKDMIVQWFQQADISDKKLIFKIWRKWHNKCDVARHQLIAALEDPNADNRRRAARSLAFNADSEVVTLLKAFIRAGVDSKTKSELASVGIWA